MKKNKKRDEFLVELRKIPIVLVACEKSGLSRNSVYRWRKEDEVFRKDMEAALKDGEELVNDMSESQLLTMIKEKNWSAISFWLKHHHPTYGNTVTLKHSFETEALTQEQEEVVREALRLAGSHINLNQENHGTTNSKVSDRITTNDSGVDDSGQES